MTAPFLSPLHFGQLHAWEQALVVLLAFGPFLLLGVVVFVVRRNDVATEQQEQAGDAGAGDPDVP